MLAILASTILIVKSNQTDVRLFCSYGRIFIEFQEGFTTWGTIMLDDQGAPIRCSDGVKTNTKLKDTI